MCTALVRFDPTDEWPFLVAFVRDEDRGRDSDPPGAWWPRHPAVIGGRDRRAGGTWLAVDPTRSSVAFLLNRLEPGLPPPMEGGGATRGTVPLDALDAGREFHLRDIRALQQMPPFHLVHLESLDAGWWRWDGSTDTALEIEPGTTVIGSRGLALAGEQQRRAVLRERFTAAGTPPLTDSSEHAWGAWIDLLDGRQVQPDDLGSIVVHSISERPGFGTVGASLVAVAADGRVRYDVNRTENIDPSRWEQVDTASSVTPEGDAPRSRAPRADCG